MVLIRDFDTTVPQTFTIVTDIETDYGIVCDYVATLVAPPAFISLTDSTLTADESATVIGDVGQHTITVEVTSALYPADVAAEQYTFTLDI